MSVHYKVMIEIKMQLFVIGLEPRDHLNYVDQCRHQIILVKEVNEKRTNQLKGENQGLRRAESSDMCYIDV